MDIEKKLKATSNSWFITNMVDVVTATQRNSWIVTVVEDKAKGTFTNNFSRFVLV
jgi:hypothetical protein